MLWTPRKMFIDSRVLQTNNTFFQWIFFIARQFSSHLIFIPQNANLWTAEKYANFYAGFFFGEMASNDAILYRKFVTWKNNTILKVICRALFEKTAHSGNLLKTKNRLFDKFFNQCMFLADCAQKDLVPLQSKFFPLNFSFVFWKRKFWREKIYFAK